MHLAFEVADLAETRFVVSPLRHALFAALCVHHPRLGAPGSIWRGMAGALPSRSIPLLDLLGRAGTRATLLGQLLWVEAPTPDTGRVSLGDELDSVTSLTGRGAAPAWDLSGGLWRPVQPATGVFLEQEQIVKVLADGLYVIFRKLLAPDWQAMRRCLEAPAAGSGATAVTRAWCETATRARPSPATAALPHR